MQNFEILIYCETLQFCIRQGKKTYYNEKPIGCKYGEDGNILRTYRQI
jgi:hypothetical protein